jgi:1,4-dihydroxy-6-naphthoate synthase
VADLQSVNEMKIAVPGINTTAHLLFSMAFPNAKNKEFLVFHEIETAVLSGAVDAGVIIHENRFTYLDKGLVKLMDLGAYWEEKLECPIPLGGIIMQNKFDLATRTKFESLIRKSVELHLKIIRR